VTAVRARCVREKRNDVFAHVAVAHMFKAHNT
jgi:hypothetical protein